MKGLRIQSLGVITNAGGDAPTAMGSVLTDLQLFDDLDLAGPDGESIGGGITPVDRTLVGTRRMGALGLLALSECAGSSTEAAVSAPIVICGPALADVEDDPEYLVDSVCADAALRIDRHASRVIWGGRAGFAKGLGAVAEILRAGRAPSCYLLAVDTLVTGQRLRRLVDAGAVIDTVNPDGVVPGEAAVAFRFTATDHGAMAVVTGFGEAPPRDDQMELPVTGRAIGHAAAQALGDARLSAAEVAALVYDAAAPQIRLEELAMARMISPLDVVADRPAFLPAVSAGETGAAAGALGLAALAFFGAQGVVNGPGLCFFSSDRGWRGAAVVAPARGA